VEEVFMVALHAADGRVDDVDGSAALLEDALADTLDGGLTSVWVADDAALADVEAAGFELRLDEENGFALPRLVWYPESEEDGRENQRGGNKGDVHGQEDWGWGVGGEESARAEEAGVGALTQGDTRVVAKLLGNLAVAGVDGEDACGSALQHAVGEAAGRGSNVKAGEAGEIDGPVFEGALELEAAAADVFEIGAEETNDGFGGDGGAWLVDALLVDKDAAGEYEGLGSLARGSVPLVDEEFVEAKLFSARSKGVGHR
jgi:hypothetical protein